MRTSTQKMDATVDAGQARVTWPLHTSAIAGVVSVVLGATVIAAMWLRVLPFVQPVAGLPAMLPHTAEWFILLGAALLLLRLPQPGELRRRIAQAFSLIVLVIAGSALVEYVLGVSLPFERSLADVPLNAAAAMSTGRSAPGPAIAFVLLDDFIIVIVTVVAAAVVAFIGVLALALVAGGIAFAFSRRRTRVAHVRR